LLCLSDEGAISDKSFEQKRHDFSISLAIETIEAQSAVVGIGRLAVYVCRLREERADQSRNRPFPASIGVQRVQISDSPMSKIRGELKHTDEPMPCIADEATGGHQRRHKIQLASNDHR
jgi:hypothetical protein